MTELNRAREVLVAIAESLAGEGYTDDEFSLAGMSFNVGLAMSMRHPEYARWVFENQKLDDGTSAAVNAKLDRFIEHWPVEIPG